VSPSSCVVLVPVGGAIDEGCDEGLRELERRGYPVWRVRGYSQVDMARNQMATDALARGFDELMWIDSDIAFLPEDVERLRGHGLPFTCGIYPKKGPRQLACEFLPGTAAVEFGRTGGPLDIRYCGFGFTHTRRAVYERVAAQLGLPVCNQRFGSPMVPYFAPMVIGEPAGAWVLGEDYAFCERARRCGIPVVADTTVRLWHVGPYRYGWEDAGSAKERFTEYTFFLTDTESGVTLAPPPNVQAQARPADRFTENAPLWDRLLAGLAGGPARALEVGVSDGRLAVWLLEHVLTHPDAHLTRIDTGSGTGQAGETAAGLEARLGSRLVARVGKGQDVLRSLAGELFDVVYVAGSHEAPDVLADAVLSWPLLKSGGLLGFDDYRLCPAGRYWCPRSAIDAFLGVVRGQFEELHVGSQLWVRKR
jgi:hypothetical protein